MANKPDITCPVLRKNTERLFRISDSAPYTSFSEAMKFSYNVVAILEPINIYDGKEKEINEEFRLSPKLSGDIFDQLEILAITYMLYFPLTFVSNKIAPELAHLDKLAKLAVKLEAEIIGADQDLFNILEHFNSLEKKDEGEPSVQEFFNRLLHDLRLLKVLKNSVYDTEIGKMYRLGQRSKKGNPALQIWVQAMYKLWTDVLGRKMKYDPKGISGRKRFLAFLEICFEPIHPELELDTIHNAFVMFEREKRKLAKEALNFNQ